MNILLIEDDRELAGYVLAGLEERRHVAQAAYDGDEGVRIGTKGGFDLVIIDRMLPGLEGIAVLGELRRAGVTAPVLMLTARGSIEDRVAGLEAGADDYLVKPFAMSELLARVEALCRRPRHPDLSGILAAGNIRLDRLGRKVTRRGRTIVLHPRELQLLEELMRNAGETVARSALLKAIWRFDFDPGTKLVESHLSRLRAKLDMGFEQSAIETVRGEGYRLRLDA